MLVFAGQTILCIFCSPWCSAWLDLAIGKRVPRFSLLLNTCQAGKEHQEETRFRLKQERFRVDFREDFGVGVRQAE